MYFGKIIFSQIIDHLPMHTFRRCVNRYRGLYKVKHFSCLDQYLCMAFAQISNTRFCSLEWASSGPRFNLEGGLVCGGRSQFIQTFFFLY